MSGGDLHKREFRECDACRAKPGSPALCGGCLHNRDLIALLDKLEQGARSHANAPIPMLLWCPGCGERHIDEGFFATKEHHTHACQTCGLVWRPCLGPTFGVRFLPGFRNQEMP